ncbi:endonuclease, partial [Salmonella enterica subsp. enterica serovar Typhimurium]
MALCAPVPHSYASIIEAGFYPEGTDLQLVLKIIETARLEIRLMDYSFTSWE